MTPQLALFLDHDTVTLSIRADGGWVPIASASLETEDLDTAMAELRAKAQEQLGDDQADPECLLVLPPDLVRHETVMVSETDPEARRARILQELDGLTPYAVEDLVFDWTGEPPELVIAIAARETLEEAETFACAHGFRPIAFMGPSRRDLFPREPDFGPTQMALARDRRTDDHPTQDQDAPPDPVGTEAAEHRPEMTAEEAPFATVEDEPVPADDGGDDKAALDPSLIAGSEKPALVTTRLGDPWIDDKPKPGLVRIGLIAALAAAIAAGAYLMLGAEPADNSRAPVPDLAAPDLAAPDLATPDTAAPDTAAPDTAAPEAATPAPASQMSSAGKPAPTAPDDPSADAQPEPVAPAQPAPRPDADAIADPAEDLQPPRAVSPEPPAEASEPVEDAAGAPRIEPTSPPTGRPQDVEPISPPADQTADSAPQPQPLPPPFGTEYELDENGWIRATPEGVPMPGGFTLHAGRPDVLPPPRPGKVRQSPTDDSGPSSAPDTAPQEAAPDDATPEPSSEDAALPPPVNPSHAALGPRPRPTEIVTAWQQKRAREQAEAEALARQIASAMPQAVASSQRPAPRPAGLKPSVRTAEVDDAAAAALAATIAMAVPASAAPAPEETVDEPEPVAPAPNIPTSTTVAKQATVANAINLRKINLIGVFGSSANRRALVRLSNGRRIKVKVGDSLDGGKVVAIGDDELSYVKSGRTHVLRIAGDG
ncbi:hypothetical protein LV82_02421 [Albidovulum inexpectatum]|uniref:Type IV pilus biogenesis protein PilP n=1 Tax=Albidovulum inexpectatum TaxID=196587 RepID=A0A2S5JEE5_9RHOB|nr:hypothetical protein [Albidovulum inexpectatum]PPB79864.1 hypothetical protein LV82_02421 [Albidovulum inexpectatum]